MTTLTQRLQDMARAIAARFSALDVKIVPVGGRTGDILTKTADSDFAMSWLAPSGGGGSGVTEGNHGDITNSSGTWTINAGVVSPTKLAVQAAGTILGNNSVSPASPIALTSAQTKALLSLSVSDVSGLGPFASGTDAANLTGAVSASRLPAIGGDVSITQGSGVTVIGPNKVTRAMLAQTSGAAVLGTSAAGNVTDLTPGQAKAVLAITAGDISGLAVVASSGSASDLGSGTIPAARLPLFTTSANGAVPASGGGTTNFLRADGSWIAPPSAGGSGTTTNSLTFNSSGAGSASGAAFDGSAAKTISYNTLGAAAAGAITASGLSMATGKLLGRVTASSGAIEELASLPAGNFPALTGDITTTTGSLATAIGANRVTRPMLAQTSGAALLGSAAAGNVSDLTAVQAKTLLAITATDVSGLSAIATSGSATDLSAGTIPAARMPAFTGDVTTTAGTTAATIANGAVTFTKMASVASGTVFYRKTAGSGSPEIQTIATLKTDLGLTGTNAGDQQMASQSDSTAADVATLRADFNALLAKLRVTASGTALMAPLGVPVNTAAPVVSGTAQVGQTLTTTNGTFTNGPTSYAIQWYSNTSNSTVGRTAITGETSSTLLQTSALQGKYLFSGVVASNSSGPSTPEVFSNITGPVAGAPVLSNLSSGWTAGQNPPDWDTQLFNAIAYDSGTGTGSSVRAQWRLGGAGAWTVEAWQGVDTELTTAVFSWPLLAAADLSAGGLFEVQVQHGIDVGLGTEHLSPWSNTWSDTLTPTAAATAYRYLQFYISGSNSGTAITTLSEIEIAASVGGADTTAGLTYTDSDNDGVSNTGAKAFDNSTSTFYSSDTSPLAPFPHTITVDYGATSTNWIAPKQLKVTARADNGGQAPKDFKLRGSADNATWTDIITVASATGWANGETRTYVAP